jgi:transposase
VRIHSNQHARHSRQGNCIVVMSIWYKSMFKAFPSNRLHCPVVCCAVGYHSVHIHSNQQSETFVARQLYRGLMESNKKSNSAIPIALEAAATGVIDAHTDTSPHRLAFAGFRKITVVTPTLCFRNDVAISREGCLWTYLSRRVGPPNHCWVYESPCCAARDLIGSREASRLLV